MVIKEFIILEELWILLMNIILHSTHCYLPKAEEEGGVWTEYWPLPGSVSSTDAARLVSEELSIDVQYW